MINAIYKQHLTIPRNRNVSPQQLGRTSTADLFDNCCSLFKTKQQRRAVGMRLHSARFLFSCICSLHISVGFAIFSGLVPSASPRIPKGCRSSQTGSHSLDASLSNMLFTLLCGWFGISLAATSTG
eukprot:TRINITY_DN2143_c0_g2_i3.p1 TRINITY_DN2143_c0_g2~~TRINITY_DN2143_c0_g2_i3.p1  ORF type:complete len:126 (+),score=2.47 TRINITY_DN2143_c0_g2_i3:1214-1591(+)